MESRREAVCPYCLAAIEDWSGWCPRCGEALDNSLARIPRRRRTWRPSDRPIAIGTAVVVMVVVALLTRSRLVAGLMAVVVVGIYRAVNSTSRR